MTFTDTAPFATGDTATFTITVQVNSGVPSGTIINNVATGSSFDSPSVVSTPAASIQVVGPIVNLVGNTFLIERDTLNPNLIDFTTDGVLYQQLASTIQQINLTGSPGNDSLTVDSSNGLMNNVTTPMPPNTPVASIPINYNASTNGTNSLILQQTGGPTLVSDTLDVGAGPNPSKGESSITDGSGNTQTIFFNNLSPFFDSVPAPILTITPSIPASLLNASNAINYTEGDDPSFTPNTAWGVVTVDSYEPLNFTNKSALVIDAGPGSDEINLNDSHVPAGSTAGSFLTGITVNGQDPTASDKLIVNGTAGADTIGYAVSGPGAGTVTVTPPSGPALPTVTFTGIENLAINGQGGGDKLTVTTIAGFDQDTLTPGAAIDSGHVDITSGVTPVSETPLDFSNLGVGGSLAFADASGSRADTLIDNGTMASDTFTLAPTTGTITLANTASGLAQLPVLTPGVANLVLNGISGADTFKVSGPQPFTSIALQGGPADPSVAKLTGDGTTAVTVTLGGTTTTVTGGGLGTVTLSGVGVINLGNGAGDIDIQGTAGQPNDLAVTPTGTDTASIQDNGLGPWVDTTTTGTLTIGGVAGNSDTVTVNGTAGNSSFTATSGATPALASAFQTVTLNPVGIAGLDINSGSTGGSLTLDSTAGAFPIPINYNGNGGSLTLTGSTLASSDTYSPGPNPGMGLSTIVIGAATQTVRFQNLAPVTDTVVATAFTVDGTASNDMINYSAGAPTTLGLVTVDNFESIAFSNKGALVIDTGTGDDTVTVNNTSTPTGLAAINVNGGGGNDTLVVNANNNPVVLTDVTGTLVSIPVATPVAIGSTAISKISIINSKDALSGSATTIAAAQDLPLNNVLVGTFGFSDQPPAELSNASSFSAAINWGDGTAITAGTIVQLPPIGGVVDFQVFGTHTYTTLPVGTFPVSVTVIDQGSSRSFTVSGVPVTIVANAGATTAVSPIASSATVAVAPLFASRGLTFTGIEGVAPTSSPLIGTFTDANPAAAIADFTSGTGSVVVNWGDGHISPPLLAADFSTIGTPNGVTFQINASHTYDEEGDYAVTITVTNVGGAATDISSTAIISDALLNTSALIQPTVSTTESAVYPVPEFGAPVFTGLVATFADVNPSATISDYTVTIDWGDGTPQSAGTVTQTGALGTPFDVTGSHTYADAGTGSYPITVSIHDVGGSELTVSNLAHVADRPIVLTGSVNLATVSGQSTGTLDVTNANQPDFYGSSEPFSWVTLTATPTGGVPMTIGTGQAQGNGAWNIASNVALPSNTYAITATAVDQFGGTTTAAPVVIAPALEIDTVAPVITAVSFNRLDATLTVTFQDNLSGMDMASLGNSAFYHLSAKPLAHNVHVLPLILPTSIIITPGATPTDPVVVNVVFHHGKELRGGLYMIDINSGSGNRGIEDNAENALSGRFYGVFPTGDGRPGGDFEAWIETYHNIVKPFVPAVSGYVPPSAAIDPPAGTTTFSGHRHLKANKHVSIAHANKVARVVHRMTSRVNQVASTQRQIAHDKALEALIHEVGGRLRRR